MGKGEQHLILSAFNYSACDIHSVVGQKIPDSFIKLHNNIGNNIGYNNIKFAVNLIGQIALNNGEFVVAEAVAGKIYDAKENMIKIAEKIGWEAIDYSYSNLDDTSRAFQKSYRTKGKKEHILTFRKKV